MGSNAAVTRFGLIRHGETSWNRERRIQGHEDSPLTQRGKRQIRQWIDTLAAWPWDRCLCSDLGRAKETADILISAMGIPVFYEAGLREQDWGEWVGNRLSDIRAEMPDRLTDLMARGWHFRPPKGEALLDVLRRGQAALLSAARRWPSERILTVAHEGTIKCLLYHCLDRDFLSPGEPAMKGGHMHWFVVKSGELALEKMNAVMLDGPGPV